MNTCISCRNKTTTDRCLSKAIKGLAYCGRHARAKVKRNWHDINHVDEKLVKIQALWKGYYIRHLLQRLGDGVLKRSMCHNEEELITMEPVSSIYPFLYFSFEEGGKIWAFEFNSICKILISTRIPLNPYTRTPLSYDTRRRIRSYARYLAKNKSPLYTVKVDKTDASAYRMNQISQILAENGFEDFRPEYLEILSIEHVSVMRSLMWTMLKNHSRTPKWKRYAMLFNNRNYLANYHPLTRLCSMILCVITDINNPKDEYEFCYMLIAAYYQL